MTRTMLDATSTRYFGTVAFFSLVAAVSALPLVGCGGSKPAAKPTPPALPVTVVAAETQDIPNLRRYPGTTQAVMQVDLVARVEGFLEERLFEEGSMVPKDEVLFIIEQPPYEADLLQTDGAVLEAEANLRLARADYERNAPLVESGAISSQDFDGYAASLATARGRLESARAARIEAEIRLGYTEVRAPFAGRIGERLVDVGNVVGGVGDPSTLATIVQLDPMRVVFEPAGEEAPEFLKLWPSTTVKVSISIPGQTDGTPIQGELDLVDNTANSSTSTFLARAEFANPGGGVLPGLVTELIVDLGELKNQVVVPEASIYQDPQHSFVWVVQDDKLLRQDVTTGAQWKGMRVVGGLKTGTKVVVSGNPLALRTGGTVKATTQTMKTFLQDAATAAKQAKAPTPAGKPSATKPGGTHSAQSPAAKASVHDPASANRHSGGDS